MGPTLPARQAEELHRSIIAYLTANNLRTSATALRQEMNLGEDVFDEPTTKKYETLLEKKWTLIGRLQKKIQELESRNTALQTELDSATPTSVSRRNQNPASWLPRAPPRHTLESHRHPINCLAFHPIFSSIATGSEDCTIKIWDWELGELERTIKSHTRTVLDVDYGGPRGAILLASCSSDLTIKLWNPADEYKNIRTLIGHDHIVSAVRFIPSSANLLVSASRDQSLRIWDVNTGYCMKKIDGHTGWVRDVCPSFDGRYLVSTGDDTSVRLWDISQPTPECKLTMVGHDNFNECCELAPPSTYQYLAPLSGLKKPPPASSAAEFMATGSRDKNIKLWDARGACILTLAGHDNWVRALAFHPGGKYLFSVSDDKTLRCWDLSQDGKCVKVLRDTHDRFVTCLRWAPGIVKEAAPAANGDGRNGEVNGVRDRTSSVAAPEVQIRCVIATGGVDAKLRIFAH